MKEDPDDDNEFNPPEEIFVRLMYLLGLLGVCAGLGLTIAGVLARDLRLLALGVAALAMAGLSRGWLQRRGRLRGAEDSFEAFRRGTPTPEEARVNELVRLLQQWEQLEKTRGSPRFDPWAVQSVRHDIRAIVERDPALERLFRV